MVEELARWKSALSMRINDLQENIKGLLEERNEVRSNCLSTLQNLLELNEKYVTANNETVSAMKSSNILELSHVSSKISVNVAAKLLKGNNSNNELCKKIAELAQQTKAEAFVTRVSNVAHINF